MDEKYFHVFTMKDGHVFLDETEIKGVEGLKLSAGSSTDLPIGQARLELVLTVDYLENTPEQNLSQAEL